MVMQGYRKIWNSVLPQGALFFVMRSGCWQRAEFDVK